MFYLNNLVSNFLIYSPLDDSRVKEVWGAYILSLSELPTCDFCSQDEQDLLLACEDPGIFPTQDNPLLLSACEGLEVDFPTQDNPVLLRACEEPKDNEQDEHEQLRAIAEEAEAAEYLYTQF